MNSPLEKYFGKNLDTNYKKIVITKKDSKTLKTEKNKIKKRKEKSPKLKNIKF